MNILLVNDDGFHSEGIHSLAKVLSTKHKVAIAAPKCEQSGMAHALSVHKLLAVKKMNVELPNMISAWEIDGTPSDCVKLYLEALSEGEKTDLVVSGINRGENLGTDIIYSGTVGAAIESYLHNIPSVALSKNINSVLSYERVAEIFLENMTTLLEKENKLPFLNINFPERLRNNTPEFVYAKIGQRDYLNACHRFEKDGELYYEIAGEIMDELDLESDSFALRMGYITVTPINIDMTDYASLENHS